MCSGILYLPSKGVPTTCLVWLEQDNKGYHGILARFGVKKTSENSGNSCLIYFCLVYSRLFGLGAVLFLINKMQVTTSYVTMCKHSVFTRQ